MQHKPTRDEYRKYLEENVNSIIKPLIVDLLKNRPDKVVDHVIQWCDTKGREIEGHRAPSNINLNQEDAEIDREVRRSIRLAEEKYSETHLPVSDHSDYDNDIEEDDFKFDEKLKTKRSTQKKNAISAEAYGDYNKLGDFKPRLIEKTEAQIEKIKNTLERNFMFNNLEQKDQDIVVAAMRIENFQKDDTVIKQGDDGDELFIVGSGHLKCYKIFEDKSEETYLKTYEPGEVFGELALLYNAPRAASIYAHEKCELYSLDRDTFNNIVKTSTIHRREKYEAFIQNIEILKELDHYERQKVCDCLTTEEFHKGELVIKEGETGDRFFLIQEGTAEAVKRKNSGEERVFEYKENDYFGELALLNRDTRKASIRVTSSKMVVASLSKDSFSRLLGPIEKILERNKGKYDKYVKNRVNK